MEAAFLHKVFRDLQLQLPELSFYFINEEQMYLILVSPLLVISTLRNAKTKSHTTSQVMKQKHKGCPAFSLYPSISQHHPPLCKPCVKPGRSDLKPSCTEPLCCDIEKAQGRVEYNFSSPKSHRSQEKTI